MQTSPTVTKRMGELAMFSFDAKRYRECQEYAQQALKQLRIVSPTSHTIQHLMELLSFCKEKRSAR